MRTPDSADLSAEYLIDLTKHLIVQRHRKAFVDMKGPLAVAIREAEVELAKEKKREEMLERKEERRNQSFLDFRIKYKVRGRKW